MEEKKLRVIVAHPGRQHSYKLASALKKAGMLDCYCTTIYDKKSSLLMKIVKKFLPAEDLKRANSRKNPDLLDKDVVQFYEFAGMVEAFFSRKEKWHKMYFFVQKRNTDRFGKKVAKLAVKRNVDAVICYDTNALKCFEYLRKYAPDIIRIQDVSHAPRTAERDMFEAYVYWTGEEELKKECLYLWNDKFIARWNKEIEESQKFLVASSFVKECLDSFTEEKNIYVVPYGTEKVQNESGLMRQDDKIRFIFVGQINYRKGVPILLEAFSELDENKCELVLVGAYDPETRYVKEYQGCKNIFFKGRIQKDEVWQEYGKSDVFVLDSFAEGFAQVGIEAMMSGLPIICSENSGVNDIVKDGENGFVIPWGDKYMLKEKLQWFVDNPDKIKNMGEKAEKVASNYTWDNYSVNVVNAIREMIGEKCI